MSKLKLYNTLTRKKEAFKTVDKKGKNVGMYSCGPTVYWYQHIGNLRTYLFSDFLRRALEYNGYRVKQIMNVTDVGHLTSDADSGEDKMERAAAKEGKSAQEIANYYLKLFKEDFKRLNIQEPGRWTKATEHIKDQIDLIKKLEKKGFTYKTSDGIYFDSSKFKSYGKLALLKKEGIKAGKRIKVGDKKHNTDFALWKFSESEGVRQQEWKSPWGVGFPGWHIECSAMSMKYLGEHFDIHTGGADHIQIHHTNEIAQSEAATGKKFVNYWIHGAWLLFKGEKVSKSKGGLFTVSELEKQGFPPLAYRYLVLGTHYRKPLSFTTAHLDAAKTSYERLKNLVSGIKDDKKTNKSYLEKFEAAMNDDLNTPRALQVLWGLVKDAKADGKVGAIKSMDQVFGLDLLKKEKVSVPGEIKKLVQARETARKKKDWKAADKIRDEITKKGYVIEDGEGGATVRKG